MVIAGVVTIFAGTMAVKIMQHDEQQDQNHE
jgi:hypothetical protein